MNRAFFSRLSWYRCFKSSVGKSEPEITGPSTSCHRNESASPTSALVRCEHLYDGKRISVSTYTSSARRTYLVPPAPAPNTRVLGIGYMVLLTEVVAVFEFPTKSVTFAVNVYTTPGSKFSLVSLTTG